MGYSVLSQEGEAQKGWVLQGHGGHGQELGFYSKCNRSHWKVLSAVLGDNDHSFARSPWLLWGGQVVVGQ